MSGADWIALFKRIPVDYHDNLVVMMATGAEVVLQTIAYLEPDYMVARGRSAGSTDTGKIFVVPYAQIDYLSFNRKISEPELKALFGAEPTAFVAAAPAAADGTAEAAPLPAPPEPPAPEPAGAAAASAKAPQLSKTVLLARLRARLGGDGTKSER
jgi:hypothetical protein